MEFIHVSNTEAIEVFPELMEMLQDHADEVTGFPGERLDPDWGRYQNLVDLDIGVVVLAMDGDKIVGYTVNILTRHLHYNFIVSFNDVIYLKPGYRGHAIKLLRATEKALKMKGAKYFTLPVKPHLDYGPLLKRFKYELFEYTYKRRL